MPKNLNPIVFLSMLSLLSYSCAMGLPQLAQPSSGQPEVQGEDPNLLWHNGFTGFRWLAAWQLEDVGTWGLDNCRVIPTNDGFGQILRVQYPAQSASPAVARQHNVPLGGAEFRGHLGIPPQEQLRLSYYLRFSDNFDFVKGGKLPGLYGGTANSGGHIPDGTDGFSTRFMWRQNGAGEVYAYLPTSDHYGTSLGQGNWQFQPGQWHHLVQEVRLNQPGQANGIIRVWLDDQLVLDQTDVVFRTTEQLQIDGIFFSTFFGGGDLSWATPQAVYADFAAFSIARLDP
ncbi:MAG: polysaccharide lyase [Leptolyngbyaceae cyanobacterium]